MKNERVSVFAIPVIKILFKILFLFGENEGKLFDWKTLDTSANPLPSFLFPLVSLIEVSFGIINFSKKDYKSIRSSKMDKVYFLVEIEFETGAFAFIPSAGCVLLFTSPVLGTLSFLKSSVKKSDKAGLVSFCSSETGISL